MEQLSPLTTKAHAIVEEIRTAKRTGAIVPNVNGLIFTRDDGRAITKGMIAYQVERVVKSGVNKFVFHNYRHSALTDWARRGIPAEVAMLASGHSSYQMHQRYVDLQANDVARAFGCENVTGIVTKKRVARRK